ncbi:4Fe-4S binding protein [bacterium]|nr:4Fe-4S binding protein [bacterium]
MSDRLSFMKSLSKLFGEGVLSFISEIFFEKNSGNQIKKESDIRQLPPGATQFFYEKCNNCGDCVEICPHNTIKSGDYPYILASKNPCYLCKDVPCSKVCQTGALEKVDSWKNIKLGVVAATFRCKNYEKAQKECFICQDICPFGEDCIEFNGFNLPIVNRDICTGCGLCVVMCPEKEALVYFNR